jgi:hypothetical protein
MTGRIAKIALVVVCFIFLLRAERVNMQVTVAVGTPVRLATQTTFANRLLIQAKHGNTGIIQVMLGVPVGTTCDPTNPAHLTAELGPGDATHPGSTLSDPQGANGNSPPDAENLALACVSGTVNSDVAIISYYRRN